MSQATMTLATEAAAPPRYPVPWGRYAPPQSGRMPGGSFAATSWQ